MRKRGREDETPMTVTELCEKRLNSCESGGVDLDNSAISDRVQMQ